MDNNKRATDKVAARSRKEDAALNRVLVWFGAAVAAECVLLLLNRYYINATTRPGELEFQGALFHAFPTLIGILAAGFILCAVWFVFAWRTRKRGLLPGILSGVFAVLLIFSVITYRFVGAGVQFLCAAVPAAAVLALVYYLYQREFFLISVLSTMGIVWLWAFRRGIGGHPALVYSAAAVAAAVLLLTVLVCFFAHKNGGALHIGKSRRQMFPRDTNCGMIYLTCGILAAVMALALLMGTLAAYYMLFAVVAWDFVIAVYYTVKLM